MLNIVLLSVVLGVASAMPQGFHQVHHVDPPADIAAATAEFIREYNRLATLAAQAPDIHIIMSDPRHNTVNTYRAEPLSLAAPTHTHAALFDKFSFTAALGDNRAFVPQAHTFPAAPTHHAGHLAGHLAGHQVHVPSHRDPIFKWNGPFADTVPAGVHGPPQQVMDTPEVKAAKAAHFAAHNAAFAINSGRVARF